MKMPDKNGRLRRDARQMLEKNELIEIVPGCHRAGVDSFMTGFATAFLQRLTIFRTSKFDPDCGE